MSEGAAASEDDKGPRDGPTPPAHEIEEDTSITDVALTERVAPARVSSRSSLGFPVLAKYELLEEIGHGGMATVYRARDPRLNRDVAVKIIHKHLRENAEVGTRFVAEARAAAKLRHPGIVEVFDVSNENDEEQYLVVELLRGATLRKVLQEHRDMPAEVGAAITLELCAAIEHAHEMSVVHRDIKPENVLVEMPGDRASANGRSSPPPIESVSSSGRSEIAIRVVGGEASADRGDRVAPAGIGDTQQSPRDVILPKDLDRPKKRAAGDTTPSPPDSGSEREVARKAPRGDERVTIKITDFGIAKMLDVQGVTSTGQVLGSPAHMAPEQIEGGEVDVRTDVFGLGVLFYESLAGHLPFEGKNPAQVLRKVLEGTYAPVERERPTAGGRWSRIVADALARDAVNRTASPRVLADQIKAELDALGFTDPRAEIAAYFADPKGFTAAHAGRLVPLLVARGEAARKKGDVTGAAADFNRALALAPHDLTILKRVGALTSSAGRRHMARRATAGVAGVAVLGLAAFGVARIVKARTTGADELGSVTPVPSSTSSAIPPVRAAVDPLASAAPVSTLAPTASASLRPIRLAVPLIPPPVNPSPGGRKVRFSIKPSGAKLTVDGQPVSWFSGPVVLTPGPHQLVAKVEGALAKCCKPLSETRTIEKPPADDPDAAQQVILWLEMNATTAMLGSAPPNAQVTCPAIGLGLFAGSKQPVKLSEVFWGGKCQFTAPSEKPHSGPVLLRAGEDNTIPWAPE